MAKTAAHAHDEERAPLRTTPQGTQAHGVEHGHEERDVDFGAIQVWFMVLAVTVALSFGIVSGFFALYNSQAQSAQVLPSQLFGHRQPPPLPRILPNPVDSGVNPMETGQMYPETVPGERKREAEEAARIGLMNPETGALELPERAVAAVIAASASGRPVPPGTAPAAGAGETPPVNTGTERAAETGTPGERVQQMMPSGASGGTRAEDRLAGE